MRGMSIGLVFVGATMTIAGCGDGSTKSVSSSSGTMSDVSRISPVPSSAPTVAAPAPSTPITPVPAAGPGCDAAPAKVVDLINAAFTNGEHLENMQSVNGPPGMQIVGGNIVDPAGSRVSSADSWVMSGGTVYALSSDARRHTIAPDGRKIVEDWTTYNDAVGECVVVATRAANG